MLSEANIESIIVHMRELNLPVSRLGVEEYFEAFSEFDRDHSGNISTSELGHVMRSLGENPTSMELEVRFNFSYLMPPSLIPLFSPFFSVSTPSSEL